MSGVPEGIDRDTTAGEPEDIVVTGKGLKRNPGSDTLWLGSDYLSRCSSIVFDRKERRDRVDLCVNGPSLPANSAVLGLQWQIA